MAQNGLSAKEAALLAAARAALARESGAPAQADAPAPAAAETAQTPPLADAASRVAALIEAARAESERVRLRQRRLYVWTPLAFMAVLGLWTLWWMWRRL